MTGSKVTTIKSGAWHLGRFCKGGISTEPLCNIVKSSYRDQRVRRVWGITECLDCGDIRRERVTVMTGLG